MTDQNALGLAPYLSVDGAAQAIAFYTDAFGAVEVHRLVDPHDGRIGHAELHIEGTRIMLADEYPDFGAVGPARLGGTAVKLVLMVADADRVFDRAVSCGATVLRVMQDEFHGHRTGQVVDPFGHIWFIQTRIEDLTAGDMQARWDAISAG